MSDRPAVEPSSIWSTDDGDHLVQVQTSELGDALRKVVRRAEVVEIGQRATAAVALVAALWRGFTFGGGGNGFAESLFAHAWTMVWVAAVGLLVGRALSARRLIGFTLTGFFFIPILVKLAHGPLTRWVGEGTNMASAVVVPVLEESLKALPLVFLLIGMRRDPSRSLSVLDFGLAGFALGAGFAMHEDLLWERTLVGGFEGFGGLLAPSLVVDPLLVVGHAGWTALIGLGIGFAVVHRGRGPAWIAAVLGVALAVGDHAAVNYRGATDVRAWVLDGRLAVIVLAGGTIAAVVSGRMVQRWAAERDRVFPAVPLPALVKPSAVLVTAGHYGRERSMAHTGAWRRLAPGYESVAQPHVPVLLYDAALQAGVNLDPAAATGPGDVERGERRRTDRRLLGAMVLVPLLIAGALWWSADEDGEVAGRPERGEIDPKYDSESADDEGLDPVVRDLESEKVVKEPPPDSGGDAPDVGPMTVILVREDVEGESTIIAARDGDRQIVRSDKVVHYRGDEGGYHCVLVGSAWSCTESAVDPWVVASIFGTFVPDPSMEVETADGSVRSEVYGEVIAGRPALCYRQTLNSGSVTEVFEFCVDPESMVVLRTRTTGTDDTFAGGDVVVSAREVRAPRPGDFDLPSGLELG